MRRRRSPWTSCGSLLLAAVLFPLSLGWLVYSYRAVAVDCQRVGERVRCSTVERIGSYAAWSGTVDDIRIVRGMTPNDNGPSGVVAETQAGDLVPLSSTTLGEDQIRAIADRLHQWLFVEQDSQRLTFVQPPSLASAGLGAGIALLAGLWGLGSLLGVVRGFMRRGAAPAGQRVAI
jgi:hypothetical protein